MKNLNLANTSKVFLKGFFIDGFWGLCKTIKEHFIYVLVVLCIIIILCVIPKTSILAWIIIAVAAFLSALKAVFEAGVCVFYFFKNYKNEEKSLALDNVRVFGSKIFDLAISVIGIFQAGKIIKHSATIAKSASSTLSVVDDAAAAVTKSIENIKNIK